MATKLENLRIRKVDFVDEGANPRADIKLFKRKRPGETEPPNEEQIADTLAKKLSEAISGFFGKRVEADPIEKGASVSFDEKMDEASTEKIHDEIWSVCYALQSSLGSILEDGDLDQTEKNEMFEQSINEFYAAVKQYAGIWASGNAANIRKNIGDPETDVEEAMEKPRMEEQEGEQLEEMIKIDKSKMTPEERAAYNEMIKKYAVDTEDDSVNKKKPPLDNEEEDEIDDEEEDAKKKQGDKKTPTKKSAAPMEEGEDIYKGIHPAVRAEIEALRKFREDAESQELANVAKKYEIVGKKPEDLIPTLKSLRAAGGTAYNDMISILDAAVSAVEHSGAFEEIGKSGHGSMDSTEGEAIQKARAKAAEIRKVRPELTEAQALDEALLANPDLLKKLDD